VVVFEQTGVVTIKDSVEKERNLLRAEVVLEAHFLSEAEVNIDPAIFASKYAPVIMLPYLREALTRLTTNAAPFAPILLPPVNVLLLKKRPAEPTRTEQGESAAPPQCDIVPDAPKE
jgi:preprotein translocase subunit SecB